MKHNTYRAFGVLTVLTVGVFAPMSAGDFGLDWWTVDGGGVMRATGGEFELSGTVGQPDAGVMAGGDFELTGGFWVAPSMPRCTATAWRSVRFHNRGLGELPIALDAAAAGEAASCETRRGGARKIEIDFDLDITNLLVGTVEAEDVTHGGSVTPSSQTVANGGTTLVLTFEPPLANETCYRLDLTGHVDGLTGDPDCLIRVLAGDTNGDSLADLSDMSQLKSMNGSDPNAPGHAKYDINVDGKIDLTDMSLAHALNGGEVMCP